MHLSLIKLLYTTEDKNREYVTVGPAATVAKIKVSLKNIKTIEISRLLLPKPMITNF